LNHLYKTLAPFAPDISGAVSALYEMGGLIVICDAGGCTGNVCGFDEPRWFRTKSAVFSAGLRDMDAILGRDDRLVAKLADAVRATGAKFSAVIGTPVPAVIGTDFRALKRMAEKKTGKPALAVAANGTALYEQGEALALQALFETFAVEKRPVRRGTVGVLGVTPLSYGVTDAERIAAPLRRQGWKWVVCYGLGGGLDEVIDASTVEKNIVASPAGLKAAEFLRERFGTPYVSAAPYLPEAVQAELRRIDGGRALVIHQQTAANAARSILEERPGTEVAVATWFTLQKEEMRQGDFRLESEAQFASAVQAGGYDTVVADAGLRRAIPDFRGKFVDFPHFAVSGRMSERGEPA
jgi:nitrogenase molybdenum-iron protein alpha/beta subunit